MVGLSEAWFFAASPMRRSPLLSHATYDGVMHDFYLRLHYARTDGFWTLLGKEIADTCDGPR